MHYISTRGKTPHKQFSDVLLMGLAPDGGLMLPAYYPKVSRETLDAWRDLPYNALAFEVMSLFATDIAATDLKALIDKTYTNESFGSDEITPVRTLANGIKILELSNGVTLAFKDIAMQFLGNAFEYVLAKKGQRLTIIGATSGDTGSAAQYALRGKDNIEVFMMSPHGKMSDFQRAQMYSLTDSNIHNIAIDGMFDDCQDIVKALQQDSEFKQAYNLSTVNSINWGRILAQIVYYFKGYFASTDNNQQKVSFCVPSGNFGNICAGHIAREMGLPIERLIVATNENDVLHDFFQTGKYVPRGTKDTFITSSPSMDISKASNFERFVYDLLGKDGDKLSKLWADVDSGKGFDLSALLGDVWQKYGFASGKSTHADRLATIAAVWQSDEQLIDPHTADGIKVANQLRKDDEIMIVAETALPVKFAQTISEAVGDVKIARPIHTHDIEKLPQKVAVLDNDVALVRAYIQDTLSQKNKPKTAD